MHRLGEPTLLPQPPLALLVELVDAVAGEELAVDASLRGLPRHRLGPGLAELRDVPVAGLRVGPGAGRAVEALVWLSRPKTRAVRGRPICSTPWRNELTTAGSPAAHCLGAWASTAPSDRCWSGLRGPLRRGRLGRAGRPCVRP